MHIQSKLSRTGKKKGKGVRGGGGSEGEPPALAGTRDTSSPTGISIRRRVFWGGMEFGMSRRIKPKRNMCAFQWRKFWRNLDSRLKNKELWSYELKFEFSRPKKNRIHIIFNRYNNCYTHNYCFSLCMVQWDIGSILHGGPTELFLVLASAPWLV